MQIRIYTPLNIAFVQLHGSYSLEKTKVHGIELFNQLNDNCVQKCIIDIRGACFLFDALEISLLSNYIQEQGTPDWSVTTFIVADSPTEAVYSSLVIHELTKNGWNMDMCNSVEYAISYLGLSHAIDEILLFLKQTHVSI